MMTIGELRAILDKHEDSKEIKFALVEMADEQITDRQDFEIDDTITDEDGTLVFVSVN